MFSRLAGLAVGDVVGVVLMVSMIALGLTVWQKLPEFKWTQGIFAV
jgi:hypothetical protein